MRFSALTYFDRKYLNRGIALVHSALIRNSELEVFFVQTLDTITYNEVSKYFHLSSRVTVLPPIIIQDKLIELREVLSGNQAFFALKPICIQRCMEAMNFLGDLVYLDADLYFFRELPGALLETKFSVALSEHIFSNRARNHVKYGRYNAGLIVFRLSEYECRIFVKIWLDSCMSTALTTSANKSFSDQLILDEISKQFRNIITVSDIRLNQGLWAIGQMFARSEKHKIDLMLREMIVFHFHGFQENDIGLSTGIRRYGRTNLNFLGLIRKVYVPYIREIEKIRIERGIAEYLLPNWKIYLFLLTWGRVKW